MKLMRHTLMSLCFFLAACTTSLPSNVQLEQYLQHYIGQSSQSIQQTLDLSALGYTPAQLIKHDQNVLIYRIPRKMSIPLSIPQAPNNSGQAPIYVPSNSSQQYSTELSCIIRFQLKEDRATSVQVSQGTC